MKKNYKRVYFDVWCKKCKFYKNTEEQEPCDECLDHPVNEDSHQPVNFVKGK